MGVSDRVREVRELADDLFFMPAPARREVADKMHGLGWRKHDELATLEIERVGAEWMGNHRMAYPVAKKAKAPESEAAMMDMLERVDPGTAAKIREARERDDVLAQMAAIEPKIGEDKAADAKRVRLARELGFDVPDDIMGAVAEITVQVDAFAADEQHKGDAERAANEAD